MPAAGKLPADTLAPPDPQAIVSHAMGRRYSSTLDQPAFAALCDLDAARSCPSFDKLAHEVTAMLVPPADA